MSGELVRPPSGFSSVVTAPHNESGRDSTSRCERTAIGPLGSIEKFCSEHRQLQSFEVLRVGYVL